MHHAAPQYGQQSSAMSANQVLHYPGNQGAAPAAHSSAASAGGVAHLGHSAIASVACASAIVTTAHSQHHDAGSTATLRQWRKKDDKFQMDSTSSAEPQGQIARVAPHNHNPLPRGAASSADAYHPNSMYVNHQYPYGMVHEQKVKYSEIVEPHQPPQHLGTPVIQKQIHSAHAPPAAAAAKEMMCSVVEQTGQVQVQQMPHHVHAAGGSQLKNYSAAGGNISNMLAYKEFGGIHAHSKDSPHLSHLNPHHSQHGVHAGQYIQKEYYSQNYKLAQYQRPLAGANQYQEYFGIPGGNSEVNTMYPYNRTHSNFSNYRNYRAANSNATVTGFAPNVQNYFPPPGGGASGSAGAVKPQEIYRGNYAGYRLPTQVSVPTFDLRNISPRRIYPEVHYAPPRGSPNYYGGPTAQQLEYAQHYQNRQSAVYPLAQINNLDNREVVGKAPYHHLIQNVDAQTSSHIGAAALEASELGSKPSSSSLKQFIEGYNPESGEELKKSELGQQQSQQPVLAQAQGQAHGQSAPTAAPQQSLYILDSTEIPSENIGEYIHLQVDKLPENIKGFLGSASSVITSPLNLTQDSVIKEPLTSATSNTTNTPSAPAPVLGISVISEAPKKAGSSVSSPSESAASSVIVFGEHNKSETVDENKNLTEASAATFADKVDTSVIKTAGAQKEFSEFRSSIKGPEASPKQIEEFPSPRTPGSTLEEIPKPLNDIEQFLDDSVEDTVTDLFVKPQVDDDSREKVENNVEVIQAVARQCLEEGPEKDASDRKISVIENIEVKKMDLAVDAVQKSGESFENCKGAGVGERVINVDDDRVTLKIGGEIIKISLKDRAICISAVTDCDVIVDGQAAEDSASVFEEKEERASETLPVAETNLAEADAETVAESEDQVEEIVSPLQKEAEDVEMPEKEEEMKELEESDMPDLQNQSINVTLEEDKVETREASDVAQLDADLYSPHSLGDIEAILNDNCNEVIIDGGGDTEVELSLSGLNSPVVPVSEIPDDEKYVIADSSDSKDEDEPELGAKEEQPQKEEDVEMKAVDTEKVPEIAPLQEVLLEKNIEEMSSSSSPEEVPVIIPEKPNLDINLDGLVVDAIPKLKKAFVHLKETDREEVRKHIECRMLEEVGGKVVKKRKRLQTMKQFKSRQLARELASKGESKDKAKKVDAQENGEKLERSEKERLLKRRRSSSEVDERKIEPWGVRSKSEMAKRKRTNSESNRDGEEVAKKISGDLRRRSHDVDDKKKDSQPVRDKTRRVSRDCKDVKNQRDVTDPRNKEFKDVKDVQDQKEETPKCQIALKVDKRKERLSLLDDSTCSSTTSSSSAEEKSKDKDSTKLKQERRLERTRSVDCKDHREKITHRRLSEKQPREEGERKHSKIASGVPNETKDSKEAREARSVKEIKDSKEEKAEKPEKPEKIDRTDGSEKIEKAEKTDKSFISEKRNFSILAKDEKTKTKIKTPSARNKRLESLVESSVQFQKAEKEKIEHSEKEKEKEKENNSEKNLCNEVPSPEENKPLVVKTKAQLKETSDKIVPADVSVRIPKSSDKSDCEQTSAPAKSADKVERQVKPAAGSQKTSFLKSVNKLRTSLAKSTLSSSVKKLSLAEYKKKRSDSLPFPEDERKLDDLLLSRSAGISADMDTLLERALDAPSLSKLNIPAIIENIPLDAIRAEDVIPDPPAPPVVIALRSDTNARPTDPRLKHLNQKSQAQSHQVVAPGTPSPGGSVYAGHSVKVYPNLEVRRRSCPTMEDPRLKRTNLDTVYADLNLCEKYLPEKEKVAKDHANVSQNNPKGCCNGSLIDVKKGPVEPPKRPQSPKVPDAIEKHVGEKPMAIISEKLHQPVVEHSVDERIERSTEKSGEEGLHALPKLPNFNYIQTLQQLKKLRGSSMSTSSDSTSDSSSSSDSDSDSSDSDSDASNSSRLQKLAHAKLKMSGQMKDPSTDASAQTCSKLDLNKEIDDIFVLTQKKFDFRPRKTGTSSECDSEPQTHNAGRDKQKKRFLINLDEIKTSLDFSDGPQKLTANVTATTSVKRKKLFIDPDDFNLDDEYMRTSSDSDREVQKGCRGKVLERTRSTGLKNIIDLNELLPRGVGERQGDASQMDAEDVGGGGSERFQKYDPEEIFRESEVFPAKAYEKFDSRIDERDIDEFINKEPPCVVETVKKGVRDDVIEEDGDVGLMEVDKNDVRDDKNEAEDGELLEENVNASDVDDSNAILPDSCADKQSPGRLDDNTDETVKYLTEGGSDSVPAPSTLCDVLAMGKEEIDNGKNNEIENHHVKEIEECHNKNAEVTITEPERLAEESTIEERAEEEMKTVEAKILLETVEERLELTEKDVAECVTVENCPERVVDENISPEIEQNEHETVHEEMEEVKNDESKVPRKEIEEETKVVPQNINEDGKEMASVTDDEGTNEVLPEKGAEDVIEEITVPEKETKSKMDDTPSDQVPILEESSEQSSESEEVIPDVVPIEEVVLEETNDDIEVSPEYFQKDPMEESSRESTITASEAEELPVTIDETEEVSEEPKNSEELVSDLSQKSTTLETENVSSTNVEEVKDIPDCEENTKSNEDEVAIAQGIDEIAEKPEEVVNEPPEEANVEVVSYDSDDDENVPMNLSINHHHHHQNDARPGNLCAERPREEVATAATSRVSDTPSSNVIVNNSFISNVRSADANSVCAEAGRAETKLPKGAAANLDQTCDHSAELICRDDVPRNSKSKPRNLCDIANGAGAGGGGEEAEEEQDEDADEGDDISCTIEETKVIFRNLRKGTKGAKGKARSSPPKSPPKDVGGQGGRGGQASAAAQRPEEKKKSIEDISKRLLGTREAKGSESESYRAPEPGDPGLGLGLSNWRGLAGLAGLNPLAYGDYAGSAPSVGSFPTFPNFQMPPLDNEMWAKWQQMQQYYQMVYFHQTHLLHQQQAQHSQSHGQTSSQAQSLDKQYGVLSSEDLKMKLHRIQPQDQPQNLSQSHLTAGQTLGDDDELEKKRRKRRRLQKQQQSACVSALPIGDAEIVSVDDGDDYLVVKTGAPAEQTGIPKLIIKRSISNNQNLVEGHAQNNNSLCAVDQNHFRAPGDDKYGLEPVVRIERNPQLDILAYNGRKRRKS